MRNSILKIIFTLTVVLCLPFSSLAKEKTPAKENPQNKTGALSAKVISEAMSQQWCKKLEECAPDSGMSNKECRSVLQKSFMDGFQNIASGHQVALTQEQLDQCVSSLSASSCDELKNAQNLNGCEFIAYLNRQ